MSISLSLLGIKQIVAKQTIVTKLKAAETVYYVISKCHGLLISHNNFHLMCSQAHSANHDFNGFVNLRKSPNLSMFNEYEGVHQTCFKSATFA